VLLAAGILASWMRAKAKANANAPDRIGALLVIVLFVLGYDYVQDLWGYGDGGNDPEWAHGPAKFVARMAPFHALHALVVLAICAFIQSRVVQATPGSISRQALDGLEVALVAAVVSSFYGWVLMKHYYPSPVTFDYMLLVILLNVAAAVIVFVAYRSLWRRRQGCRQGIDAPEPARYSAAAE